MHENDQVTVIMPVYNEGNTVYSIIKRVLAQPMVDLLLIVYDASTDNTLEEIKRAMHQDGDKRCMLVMSDKRLGKGYAVRQGMRLIKSGIVIIQDADDEYYPEDYKKLLSYITDTQPVFGSRPKNDGKKYFMGVLATKVHTGMFNMLYGQHLRDINSAYKIFKVSMLKGRVLVQDRWAIDPEIAVTLAKNGYIIRSVDIRYKGRSFKEGKKIGAKDGIEILIYIIKQRFFK
ncbi:MAG: glycosyltransferase family 2 protein [Candidatus Micrarchaeaceae archaeon]